jgi:hypothetical protein
LLLKGTNVDDASLIHYLHHVQTRFGECRLETLDLSAISKEKSLLIGDKAAKAISVCLQFEEVVRIIQAHCLTIRYACFVFVLLQIRLIAQI